jgi:hypothetical protein
MRHLPNLSPDVQSLSPEGYKSVRLLSDNCRWRRATRPVQFGEDCRSDQVNRCQGLRRDWPGCCRNPGSRRLWLYALLYLSVLYSHRITS